MPDNLAQLYENMAMLLRSGIPILRAVQLSAKGMSNHIVQIFDQIHRQMQQGDDFSKCIQSYPKFFDSLDCIIIQCGELSGSLDEAFEQLAQWHRYRPHLEKFSTGKAIEMFNLSRFCRVFSMLYRAGVPAAKTMELALKAVNSPILYRHLAGGLNAARSGAPISTGFSSKLPEDFLQLWKIGEQTAELETMTRRLSQLYWQQALSHMEALEEWIPKMAYILLLLGILFAGLLFFLSR
ncbi:MAG: type II secretion system F family protein [Sedimentisphaerales bacterium]|nr:type II secretion system F family protein [Sedimentisphaerales bacterium]